MSKTTNKVAYSTNKDQTATAIDPVLTKLHWKLKVKDLVANHGTLTNVSKKFGSVHPNGSVGLYTLLRSILSERASVTTSAKLFQKIEAKDL